MDDLGTIEMTKGVYVIVDGGYHKWKATISASRHGDGIDYTAWRKGLESVRKDIECGECFSALNAAMVWGACLWAVYNKMLLRGYFF